MGQKEKFDFNIAHTPGNSSRGILVIMENLEGYCCKYENLEKDTQRQTQRHRQRDMYTIKRSNLTFSWSFEEECGRASMATEENHREGDLVELTKEPLNLKKYVDAVRHPSAGAIATFSGTTRDNFHGRPVLTLEYEAYEPMAARQIRMILSSARSRWSLMSVAAAHRIGTVPISEESVIVAVSAVHRGDAINACHFVIDEIKASVPVWKKEVYADGEVWKENAEFFANKDALVSGPDVPMHMTRTAPCCQKRSALEVGECTDSS